MKNIIIGIIGLIAVVGIFSPNTASMVWDEVRQFGATSYPGSLDTFTNPSATDSVATVSHSGQHSNANDAIEAIQAKVGTGASTAVTDSIFVGNGAGTSAFSLFATSTQFSAVNFLATGSSTLQAFSFTSGIGVNMELTDATTTNATSTNLFSTNASSTNQYGANLATCNSGQFLQWDAGKYACDTPVVSGNFSGNISTSSNSVYRAKTVSMENGDQIWWWGSCSHNNGGITIASTYKTSNDSATTTILSSIQSGSGDNASTFGYFLATTTYSVTVESVATAGGCDQGHNFTHLLIGL